MLVRGVLEVLDRTKTMAIDHDAPGVLVFNSIREVEHKFASKSGSY